MENDHKVSEIRMSCSVHGVLYDDVELVVVNTGSEVIRYCPLCVARCFDALKCNRIEMVRVDSRKD